MPNPETQRSIGFSVLGGVFVASVVGAYLFAKLLFEQYKQKVLLSEFAVPSTIPIGVRSNVNAKGSFGGALNIIVVKSTIRKSETRWQPSDEMTAVTRQR